MNNPNETEEEIFQRIQSKKMSGYSKKYWDNLSPEEKSEAQSRRAKKRWYNYHAMIGENLKKSKSNENT